MDAVELSANAQTSRWQCCITASLRNATDAPTIPRAKVFHAYRKHTLLSGPRDGGHYTLHGAVASRQPGEVGCTQPLQQLRVQLSLANKNANARHALCSRAEFMP